MPLTVEGMNEKQRIFMMHLHLHGYLKTFNDNITEIVDELGKTKVESLSESFVLIKHGHAIKNIRDIQERLEKLMDNSDD